MNTLTSQYLIIDTSLTQEHLNHKDFQLQVQLPMGDIATQYTKNHDEIYVTFKNWYVNGETGVTVNIKEQLFWGFVNFSCSTRAKQRALYKYKRATKKYIVINPLTESMNASINIIKLFQNKIAICYNPTSVTKNRHDKIPV